MREETKLVKEILKLKYPDKKFKFRYKMANNYMDSSDTLTITCERWMDIDEVISYLNKHVDRIKVFKQDEIASIHHRHINSRILSVDGKWIEAGTMEFIEVRNE